MDLLPDWAPNVHPLIVHFPVALLMTAVLLDLGALLFRKAEGLRVAAVSLYLLGAAGALAAFFTGRDAADSVMLPAAANTVLTEHADWALYTVWFFGIYALIRLGVLFFDRNRRLGVHIGLFLAGAAGLFLVYETAEHGGELVFAHGVGVAAVEVEDPISHDHEEHSDGAQADSAAAASAPEVTEGGGWTWRQATASGLAGHFRWLAGSAEAAAAHNDAGRGRTLALDPGSDTLFFVFDQDIESLQADAAVNLDGFDGAFRLVHHVQDAGTYLYLEVENGTMRQGRVEGGQETIMDEKPFDGGGWLSLRAVADKTHFRGYAGGALVTHGHGDAPAPGAVGFRLAGSGPALLGPVQVQSLR